jgi:hypothetical protein
MPQKEQVSPRVLVATAHLPFPRVCVELEPVEPCDEAAVVHVLKSLGSRRSVGQNTTMLSELTNLG